jgi:HAE1 family hydrophobic/amphiphilic exporter-1
MTSFPVARPVITLLLVSLLSLAAAVPSRSQVQDPTDRVTLEQAVQVALRQNHDVLRARQALARLDGQIEVVTSDVYPQVGLEADYFHSYDESILDTDFGDFVAPEHLDTYGIRGTLNQLLFSWGKASTAIEISRDSRQRAEDDLSGTVRRVKLQVHEAFYALLLDQRLVEVARLRLEQRRRQLAVAQKKFAAGVVNEFEVVRARVDVANAEPPVIRTENQVRQDISRLNNLLARGQRAPLAAAGELAYEPLDDLTREQVVERAVSRRPELKSLRTSKAIAEKALKIARAGNKPEVHLAGQYGWQADTPGELGINREKWAAGVAMTMPLFDGWRTRGRVAEASSDLLDIGIATSQLEDTIVLQATVVLDDLREARDIIDSTTQNIGQAEKALELAETSYRYGVATALDVTDAELSLSVARTDHARALHDFMVARARTLSVMDDL